MRHIEVIAHKGAFAESPVLPENSRAAFERARTTGVDWVEFDVHTTRDGVLVVIHDGTVDRVTCGTGAVSDIAFAELRALRLADGSQIPTADETLEMLRTGAGAYLEIKNAIPEMVVDTLSRQTMIGNTVIYGRYNELARLRELNVNLRLMMNRPPSDYQTFREVVGTIRPEVFGSSWRDISREQVDRVHDVGARLWVNTLGTDQPDGWARIIDLGGDALETDHPSACLAWLREQGLRH